MDECDVTDLTHDTREYMNPESKVSGGPMTSIECYQYLKDFLGLPPHPTSFTLVCELNDFVVVSVDYMPRSKD